MPTEPRPAAAGASDEDAALAFAAAAAEAPAQAESAQADELARRRDERVRRILDFEAGFSVHGAQKARAIRAEFGWTPTRYYQVLDGLLEEPAALQHDPMLVRRLLRLREGR